MEQILEIVMSNVRYHDSNTSDCSRDDHLPSYGNKDVSQMFSSPVKGDVSRFEDNTTAIVLLPDVVRGSNETEYKIAGVLWQVCPVFLFAFGTVGNIMILLMLRTLRLGRTSMHVYLRALAISDLCVLYTGLLRWWIIWSFGIDIRDQHVVICKLHTWMVYMALYISAWLLVFMTSERTCSACVPHRVSSFCTKRRACCLIIFIVIFQSLMQSHFLFGMSILESEENGTQRCETVSEEYHFFIHDVYPFVDLVLLSLIPFFCVILGNVIIIWKTFLSIKTAAELNLTSYKGASLRRRRASSMTVILVCLSTLFLLTTSPTCVYNMWERGESAQAEMKTSMGVAKIELAWASVNIIMYCNNTFNFYLYCLSGRKFRTELRRQFSRRRTDSHSVVLSAPSIHLHRCPQNEQKYSPNRENGAEHPKSRENERRASRIIETDSAFPRARENSIGFLQCTENDKKFSQCIDKVNDFLKVVEDNNALLKSCENSNGFNNECENSKGFHKKCENSNDVYQECENSTIFHEQCRNSSGFLSVFDDANGFLRSCENANDHQRLIRGREVIKGFINVSDNDTEFSQSKANNTQFPESSEINNELIKVSKPVNGFVKCNENTIDFSEKPQDDSEVTKSVKKHKEFHRDKNKDSGFHTRKKGTSFYSCVEIDSGFRKGRDDSMYYHLFGSQLYAQRSVTFL